MTESYIKQINDKIKIKKTDIRISSLTHNVIPILGKISLRVRLSRHQFLRNNFLIVPDLYLRTPVLMGADLIGKRKFIWDGPNGCIQWAGKHYPIRRSDNDSCRSVNIMQERKNVETMLQVAKKFRLHPDEVNFCHFSKLRSNSLYLVEKFKGRATRNLNVVKAGLFTSNSEGKLCIPMWTCQKNDLILKPGTAVAVASLVEEPELIYCTNTGEPLGTRAEVTDSLTADMRLCHSHKEALGTGNSLSTMGECAVCTPTASVNKVGIANDMLPHFDIAPGGDRFDRLKYLIKQLDLAHLDESQSKKLECLLLEFNSLFVLDKTELGCIQGPEENFPMLDTCPVRAPMYRHPEQAKETISEMIEEMLEKGVIEPSSALYLAPIVLVDKGSGKKRMCVDYRKVNEHIKQDIYPLPRLDSLIEEVAGYKYYCTLDMKDAYYQVPLESQARDVTTFSDGVGLYRFTRLPFGLSVSPAIFTRAMQRVLEPLTKAGWVRNYLDDVIIYAHTYDDLLDRLRLVLERFKQMGLKLNVSKCEFARAEIKFLGHLISNNGMKPDPKNTKKVMEMKPPNTVRQVRRFLGLMGFYRRFIPKFSKIATPLTDLTKKDRKFIWTAEAQQAFDCLRNKLVEEPILVKFNLKRDHELHTDASKYHVGAVLLQRETDGLKSVGYFSKKLNKTEQGYSTTDKEALAIVKACQFFHHYLWSRKFIVVTDHQPLMNIFRQKTKCQRMSRYLLEMRDYNFKVVYKPGRIHQVPDALSRPMVAQIQDHEISDEAEIDRELEGIEQEHLRREQRSEPRWNTVIQYLENGPIPKKIPGNRPITNFHLIDEILHVMKGEVDRNIYCMVIPKNLVQEACKIAHDEGHFGERKSIQRAQRLFYWPSLWTDVKRFVKSCPRCQQFRNQGGLNRKWKELPVVEEKGERVSIDLMDLYNGQNGYRYVLSVVDHFSRFLRTYPLRNKMSETIVKILRRDISIFGKPKVLLMDNGLEFKNMNVQLLCKDLGITQAFCMPYHPQGNSVSERIHKTLKSILAKANQQHPNRWPDYLQDCTRIINESVHTSLGTSPFFAHFGFHPLRIVGNMALPSDLSNSSPSAIRALIRQTLKEKTHQYRTNANRKRADDVSVIGDWVWVKNECQMIGTAAKLNPSWIGPYKVIRVLNGDKGYQVEDPFTGTRIERGSEKIKKAVLREDILVQPLIVPQVPEVEWAVQNRPQRIVQPPCRFIP